MVNPICPCGGKTTKKQKCIVSSVLLPFASVTLAIIATIDSVQNYVIAFLYNHKDALEGSVAFSFSYVHRKLLIKWKVKK